MAVPLIDSLAPRGVAAALGLTLALLVLALLAPVTVGGAVAAPDPQQIHGGAPPGGGLADLGARRIPLHRWQEYTARPTGLLLGEGRRLYRGPRYLGYSWPYLAAATADERSAGYAHELTPASAGAILGSVSDPEHAVAIARLFSGGVVIPDLGSFVALREAARALQKRADHWKIDIPRDDLPARAGVHCDVRGDHFAVSELIFTSSGYSALDIAEVRTAVYRDGRVTRDVVTWVSGPPQSWQTAGSFDPHRQNLMHAEVERFRAAMCEVLARSRTLAWAKRVIRPGVRFSVVRRDLGEPDRDVGQGLHVYVYGLADGTAIIAGTQDDDAEVIYARHVRAVSPGGPGEARVGETLEDLLVREGTPKR